MSINKDVSKGIALVTGASSGIGAVYADRLAKRGYDVVIVARNEERLKQVAKRIGDATGRSVRTLAADLNNKRDLAQVEALLREDPGITMLVNNAGFGEVTPLMNSNVDKMQQMIEVNVTALTRLTYAVAPQFVERRNGAIINIASIVAIGPEILNGVYGGTKAFVLAFTQSLQHELASEGVRLQAVLPGATATEFWDLAGFPHSNFPSDRVMSAEDMVDAALVGFDHGEVVTIPPLQEGADWAAHEASRVALAQKFGHARPGARYVAA